jgi:hypothetical protein
MLRKLIYLVSVVLLLGSVVQAADIQWTDLGADHLWSTPENWEPVRVPTLADEVLIDVPAAAAPNGPVIQDGIDAKAKGILTEAPGEPTLTITGGTLEVAEWIWLGDGEGSFGIWDMSGGALTVGSEFELGWGGGAGTLTMTGGTISAAEAVIPTGSGVFGELYLYGGTYNVTNADGFSVKENGMVDITEGTLVLEGDDTAKVNDLIAAGQITAYGGSGQLEVDYDVSNPGKTTLTAIGQVAGVDDPSDMADSSGDIKRIEAWVEDGNLNLTMTVYGVFAPEVQDTPAGMTNRYYYHWLLDTDTDPATGYNNSEYEGNATNVKTPIGVDLVVQFGWRDGNTNGVYAYDPLTEVSLFEDYEYTIDGDTIHAVIPLEDLGLDQGQTIALSAYQEGASNDWQVDWIESFELTLTAIEPEPVDPGADGLVAFYALDGDANDSSGNGNDGTINNPNGGLGIDGSVWVDDPERGTVISFNGTAEGAFVRAGDIPQMTLTNDFTWTFWAKHSDENTADNDIILGNRMDENAVDFVPRQFIKFTPTKFEWHMNGNGDDNMDYDDIPADIWLHHAVVKTGDQLTYYRNGVEGGSGTIAQPLDFPQPLYFGGDNEGSDGENWSGLMSEVAIYDRALSVGEVRYLAGERAGDPSLVIYYDFDEVGDIVADQSGKGHDGTVVGDVTAEAEGMYGGAANFATGSYLDLDGPSIPAEDIPTSAMTLAAWIKIANTGGDHEIFSARASDESWLIHPEPKSSGDIRWLLRSYGGTTIFQIRAGTVTWDEWLHFAGTYDKATGKAALYINGELIEEMDVTDPADIAGDWDLGARVGLTIDDGRPFTGLMDEFRMYKRALSQDEILTIMQGM